jgi:hypothetical protein
MEDLLFSSRQGGLIGESRGRQRSPSLNKKRSHSWSGPARWNLQKNRPYTYQLLPDKNCTRVLKSLRARRSHAKFATMEPADLDIPTADLNQVISFLLGRDIDELNSESNSSENKRIDSQEAQSKPSPSPEDEGLNDVENALKLLKRCDTCTGPSRDHILPFSN